MMRYPLKSSFAEQIRSFVDYKNSLGFPYDESCRILWLSLIHISEPTRH